MFTALIASPVTTFAATCSNNTTFLGILKPWYAYLKVQKDVLGNCSIGGFNALGNHSGFLLIGLALLDDLLRIAALVAVGYVIYGGIQYTTSQGTPEATSKAQQTILNALIGLVLAILASAIVAFVGNRLG